MERANRREEENRSQVRGARREEEKKRAQRIGGAR